MSGGPLLFAHHEPISPRFLFLDRDGVVVENCDDYLLSTDDIDVLPGAPGAIARAQALGFSVALVTNQSPIGRGLISTADLVAIQDEILGRLAACGAHVAISAICPHEPDDDCGCRKPAPDMLHAIAANHPVAVAESWMVGDAITDMECARRFGVPSVLVETGRGRRQLAAFDGSPFFDVVPDLAAAVNRIAAHQVTQAFRHETSPGPIDRP